MDATLGSATMRSTPGRTGSAHGRQATQRIAGQAQTLRPDPVLLDMIARKTALVQKRADLLRAQASVSTDLHTLLAGPEGLNFFAERERRNVLAALNTARQMGYFKYFVPPVEVKKAESGNFVGLRVKELRRVQGEIDTVDAEIATLERTMREHSEPKPPPVTTLAGWFAVYSRPEGFLTANAGYGSEFRASSHRYGGSKHYPGFTSVSSRLIVGRALK
jgi:hypothetical protein